jgi:hypothetical protein
MGATAAEGSAATVREFYGLVMEGRLEDACDVLHDDLVIRVPPGLPYSGDYHGPAGFLDDMSRITEMFEPKPLQVDYLTDGDPVVLKILGRFTSRASGQSLETDIVELFYVRDGKIAELDIYYKDPAALTALATP